MSFFSLFLPPGLLFPSLSVFAFEVGWFIFLFYQGTHQIEQSDKEKKVNIVYFSHALHMG